MGSRVASLTKVVTLEAFGFLLILAILLLDEWFDLPHHLLGAHPSFPRAEEYLIEGIAIFGLAVGVVVFSVRLLRRMRRLESYLLMCAWCRRIRIDGRWVVAEEYLRIMDDLKTSHGICPECAREIRQSIGERTWRPT